MKVVLVGGKVRPGYFDGRGNTEMLGESHLLHLPLQVLLGGGGVDPGGVHTLVA